MKKMMWKGRNMWKMMHKEKGWNQWKGNGYTGKGKGKGYWKLPDPQPGPNWNPPAPQPGPPTMPFPLATPFPPTPRPTSLVGTRAASTESDMGCSQCQTGCLFIAGLVMVDADQPVNIANPDDD